MANAKSKKMTILSTLIMLVVLAFGAPSLHAEANKNEAIRYLIYGNVLYKQGNAAKAEEAYRQATVLDPKNADSWKGLGNVLVELDRPSEAAKAYRQSLKLNPDDQVVQGYLKRFPAPAEEPVPVATPIAPPSNQEFHGGSWASSAWRSAILPGWGQVYNGQTGKGVTIGIATLGLLAGTVVTYSMSTDAENRYLAVGASQPQSAYDTPYQEWDTYSNVNHVLYICFGLAYTYNLIDAIIGAKTQTTALRESKVKLALIRGGMKANYEVLKF